MLSYLARQCHALQSQIRMSAQKGKKNSPALAGFRKEARLALMNFNERCCTVHTWIRELFFYANLKGNEQKLGLTVEIYSMLSSILITKASEVRAFSLRLGGASSRAATYRRMTSCGLSFKTSSATSFRRLSRC